MCNIIRIVNFLFVIVHVNSQYLRKPRDVLTNNQTYESNTNMQFYNPNPLNSAQNNLPFCCERAYNAKQFFLLSPGFPSINNSENDCVYQIYRANTKICRLRIIFRFFWLENAAQNYGCFNNFLEIDGKPICGCQIGLQLISPFDTTWNNRPKILRLKRKPLKNSVSGFAIEIIQDECFKRIVPEERNLAKREISSQDESRNIFKHYYFFDGTRDDNNFNVQRDTEETLYIDTSATNFANPQNVNHYECQTWGKTQWEVLASKIPNQQMSKCSSLDNNSAVRCQYVIANYQVGYIHSPGYPNGYTGSVNLCYRILTIPNSCAVRVRFEDFQLVNSFNCQRDYLKLSGRYRYCGQSLHKTTLTFDLRNKKFEELNFRTLGNSCGRGFRAVYEHIPCYNVVNPPKPVYPIIKPTPSCPEPLLPITTLRPPNSCNRIISDYSFAIEVFQENRCVFNIFKSRNDVCQLSLTFDVSNLVCGSEYLIIDNKKYCGQLGGQTVNVNFSGYQLSLIYERSTINPIITGLRFRLAGTQMTDGCDPYELPEVPAQRLLFSQNNAKNDITFPQEPNEVCGVVVNGTVNTISHCEELRKRGGSKSCVQIQSNELYIPFDTAARDNVKPDNSAKYEVLCKDVKKLIIDNHQIE